MGYRLNDGAGSVGRVFPVHAKLDRTAWEAAIVERWSPHLYVFAGDLRDDTLVCRLRINQGVAMGRPSTLHGTAYKENGLLTQVTVGGHAIVVGSGTMNLPTDAVRRAR